MIPRFEKHGVRFTKSFQNFPEAVAYFLNGSRGLLELYKDKFFGFG